MTRRPVQMTVALLVIALCAGAGLAVQKWVIGLTRISGASMSDTLQSGDIVLVTRLDYAFGQSPEFGDVVECRFAHRRGAYVKRVVGLPGDTIAFQDGMLTRNGTGVSEPYVSSPTEDYAVTLDGDSYLLLGDNRAESYDSRMEDMGFVHSGDFLGRARFILWPLHRFGPID